MYVCMCVTLRAYQNEETFDLAMHVLPVFVSETNRSLIFVQLNTDYLQMNDLPTHAIYIYVLGERLDRFRQPGTESVRVPTAGTARYPGQRAVATGL